MAIRSTRREFLKRSAAIGAGALAGAARDAEAQSAENVPASIRALAPMTGGIVPITAGERRGGSDGH